MNEPKRIIVGITGASGALYARRLVELLLDANVQVHLVVSPLGQRLLHDELGIEATGQSPRRWLDIDDEQLIAHHYRDVGAPIASGSFKHDGMAIVPCSSNTLSAVATGSQQNLLHRAAAVTLKERRRLLLLHREMPLSAIDIRNMQLATEAGAVICPASPGFYLLPKSIDDLVDFVVGRVLDLFNIDHQLNIRWGQTPAEKNDQSDFI